MWQQHRRHVAAGANHAEYDRFLRLPHRRRRTKWNLTRYVRFRIVIENHTQVRLLYIARDQLVSAVRFGDRKPVRRQTFDVDPLLAGEFEKALDVSFLGPTHVGQRIVVSSLFVLRIVTTWPIRHRDDQFELATEERLSRNVHAGHADNNHATFQTRHSRRKFDRLV